MCKYIIIIFPVFFTFIAVSQNRLVDSLHKEAIHYLYIDLQKASEINETARRISKEANYKEGQCESSRIYATILREDGEYEESYEEFRKTVILSKKLKNKHKRLEVQADFIALQYLIGEYDQAIINGKDILEEAEEINDYSILAKTYNIISCVYDDLEEKADALKYGISCVEAAEKSGDDRIYLICLHNLADRYYSMDDFDSAIEYYKSTLTLAEKMGNKDVEAGSYDGIGLCYFEQKKYDLAKRYFNDARTIHVNMADSLELAYNATYLGEIEKEQSNFKEALVYFEEAENLLKSKGGLENHHYIIRELSNAYADNKEYEKATMYYKEQQILADSLYHKSKSEATEEFNAIYQTKELEVENSTLEVTRLQQKNIIAIISSILLGLLALFAFFYKNHRQAKKIHKLETQQLEMENHQKEMEKQQMEVEKRQLEAEQRERDRAYQEKIERILQEHEEKFINAVVKQEEANHYASQELHDHAGNNLLSVVWSMNDYIEEQKKKNLESAFLEKTNDNLYRIYEDVRKVSHKIKTNDFKKEHLLTYAGDHVVENQELEEAVEELYELISGERLQAKVYVSGNVRRLEGHVEIYAYRIIKELTSNVLKHANATKLDLQLNYLEDELQIVLEDNGIGFELEKLEHKGLGLDNIDAVIESLEGNWEIDSGKGGGTTIMIDLPANTLKKVA